MAAPVTNVKQTSPSYFPVKTKQTAVQIGQHKTELVCTQYDDKIFIIATQYEKIGTLVKVSKDNIVDETGASLPMYSTYVLMGKDEPMTHVIAKLLISKLDVHKPILLSVALKDSCATTVKTLASILPSLI